MAGSPLRALPWRAGGTEARALVLLHSLDAARRAQTPAATSGALVVHARSSGEPRPAHSAPATGRSSALLRWEFLISRMIAVFPRCGPSLRRIHLTGVARGEARKSFGTPLGH